MVDNNGRLDPRARRCRRVMIRFCRVEWNRKWESGFERMVANNGRLEPRTRKCRSDDKVSIRSDDRVSMGRQEGARGVIVDKVSIYDRVSTGKQ